MSSTITLLLLPANAPFLENAVQTLIAADLSLIAVCSGCSHANLRHGNRGQVDEWSRGGDTRNL